tara:strand:+ start:162 stop:500 length:339 start_codon:yes stop_codon:yes gene_type:complete
MNEIHSFKKIIKDLGDNLKSNKKNMKQVSDDYYLYDRIKFVSKYHDKDRDIDLSYHIDLESISTFLIQLSKYGRIIMTDDEDRDIRTKQIIEEKKLTNKQKLEKKNGLHKVS